jgi:alanine racemase
MYSTWLEVDLNVLENNVHHLSSLTKALVMAIVKADGYGHGAIPVAKAAVRGGASWCGVARIEEATLLRAAGLQCPILLLGFTPTGRIEQAIGADLSMTVWQEEQVRAVAAAAARMRRKAKLHLKVDTGMGRIGVEPQSAVAMARLVSSNPYLTLEGVFTHFARADEEDPAPTNAQLATFADVVRALDAHSLRPPLVHAANSAATLTRPDAHFDLVRTGICIYGLHPASRPILPKQLKPVLTWKAQLSHVKEVPPGTGVGYGHTYRTTRPERIGTVPVGYADGLRRGYTNEVLIRGTRVPVVGAISMDQCTLRLDMVPDAACGDEVVLLGQQGHARISAEEIARRWDTINYDVVASIGARVPRVCRLGRAIVDS